MASVGADKKTSYRHVSMKPSECYLSVCSEITWNSSEGIKHGQAMTLLDKVVYVYG